MRQTDELGHLPTTRLTPCDAKRMATDKGTPLMSVRDSPPSPHARAVDGAQRQIAGTHRFPPYDFRRF
jgi:hypothetical protein